MQGNWRDVESWRVRWREAMKMRWVRVAGGIASLILIVVIVLPFFVNADTFRPAIENAMSSALGRKVTLGHLSFSLLTGSLVADNVAIADDPGFGTEPFFEAKSLHIGVSTAALVFHRQARITRFTADSPRIRLIPGPNGTWNYSSLGHGGSSSASPQQSSAPEVSVGELKIRNGSVVVSSLPSTGKPFVYDHLDLTVKHLSYTTPMPFELTADLPGNGTLKLNGTAGPVSEQNAMNTPLQASLDVKHFDPVAAGIAPPSEGVSMVADLSAQVTSDGQTLTTTGKIQAAKLKLSPNGSPAAQPVNVDFKVTDNLGTRAGQVSDIAIHTGAVAAHVTGTYQMTGEGATLNLHLAAPGLPVDGLEQLLPAIGIRLPSGSSLHGGTLTANLTITGAATAPQIAGPVEIDNTRLAGFDLGSEVQGLSKLVGAKSGGNGGTEIRTLRADVTSTPQSTELSKIYGDVPSLGTATGNGTVSGSGALDFQLVASLGASGEAGGGAMGAVGSVAGNFLHTASGATRGGIPLTITGTTADPSIRLNTKALLKQETSGLLGKNSGGKSGGGVTGLAKGLLGGR